MTRIDKDKYSVLIRGDYLHELGELSTRREERDNLIAKAVAKFLRDYAADTRLREIRAEAPRLRITHAEGHKPDYYMYFEIINLPDSLFDRMDRENRHEITGTPFCPDLGTALNAAIRLYLQAEAPHRSLSGMT